MLHVGGLAVGVHQDRGYAGSWIWTSENTSLPLYVSSEVHILDDAQGG
jgi:hypothetical protein